MTQNEIVEKAASEKPQRQSKMEKKQKNLYLSAQARLLLSELSLNMGISETAVVELLLREKAARENIVVSPRTETEKPSSHRRKTDNADVNGV